MCAWELPREADRTLVAKTRFERLDRLGLTQSRLHASFAVNALRLCAYAKTRRIQCYFDNVAI